MKKERYLSAKIKLNAIEEKSVSYYDFIALLKYFIVTP